MTRQKEFFCPMSGGVIADNYQILQGGQTADIGQNDTGSRKAFGLLGKYV
jgi:hypothetical protein